MTGLARTRCTAPTLPRVPLLAAIPFRFALPLALSGESTITLRDPDLTIHVAAGSPMSDGEIAQAWFAVRNGYPLPDRVWVVAAVAEVVA